MTSDEQIRQLVIGQITAFQCLVNALKESAGFDVAPLLERLARAEKMLADQQQPLSALFVHELLAVLSGSPPSSDAWKRALH